MKKQTISGVGSREMSDNRRATGFPDYTCGTAMAPTKLSFAAGPVHSSIPAQPVQDLGSSGAGVVNRGFSNWGFDSSFPGSSYQS